MELLKKINKILDKKLKIYLFFIFSIIFLTMILETISLASFYPLLEILSASTESATNSELRNFFINILKYLNVEENNIFVAIILIVASLFIFKILILLFCNWHTSNFSFALRFYLTKILYKTYLRKNYQSLIKYNSADIIKNIEVEGVSGGNLVKVVLTGDYEIKAINIDFLILLNRFKFLSKIANHLCKSYLLFIIILES